MVNQRWDYEKVVSLGLMIVASLIIGAVDYALASISIVGGVPSAEQYVDFKGSNPLLIIVLICVSANENGKSSKTIYHELIKYFVLCTLYILLSYVSCIALTVVFKNVDVYISWEIVYSVIIATIFVIATSGCLAFALHFFIKSKAVTIIIPLVLYIALLAIGESLRTVEIGVFIWFLPYQVLTQMLYHTQSIMVIAAYIAMVIGPIILLLGLMSLKKTHHKNNKKHI